MFANVLRFRCARIFIGLPVQASSLRSMFGIVYMYFKALDLFAILHPMPHKILFTCVKCLLWQCFEPCSTKMHRRSDGMRPCVRSFNSHGICFVNPANRESSFNAHWALTICRVYWVLSIALDYSMGVFSTPQVFGPHDLSGVIWRYVFFGNHFASVFATVILANRESSIIIDLEYDSRVCVICSPGFEPHYLSGVIWRYVFLAAISHVYLQQ